MTESFHCYYFSENFFLLTLTLLLVLLSVLVFVFVLLLLLLFYEFVLDCYSISLLRVIARKEQSFQAAVSSWMVQLETTVGYKDGLAEALSARCALLIQVLLCMHAPVLCGSVV